MKRKDADLIRDLDPFHSITPYVMPKRTEAEVSITENFDITELNKYLAKYDVKCYDQTTYKYLTDNGYVVGVK